MPSTHNTLLTSFCSCCIPQTSRIIKPSCPSTHPSTPLIFSKNFSKICLQKRPARVLTGPSITRQLSKQQSVSAFSRTKTPSCDILTPPSAMLDSKVITGVTSPAYNLSTNDLPDMTMPLRRFFPAGEVVRAHPAALGSQGDMYDGREFWWTKTHGISPVYEDGAISSKNGGVLASNIMHLAAYKHLQELWSQHRLSEVPWCVCRQQQQFHACARALP